MKEKFYDHEGDKFSCRIIMTSEEESKAIYSELEELVEEKINVLGIIAMNIPMTSDTDPQEATKRLKFMKDLIPKYFGKNAKNTGALRLFSDYKSTMTKEREEYTPKNRLGRFDIIIYS